MPCEPRYTARRLAFTLSILPVFPFNFSRYLPRFHTLIEFLAANPFFSYSCGQRVGRGAARRALRANHSGSANRYCLTSFRRYFIFPRARMSDPSTLPQSSRCTHLDALNRRCRMNLSPSHPYSLRPPRRARPASCRSRPSLLRSRRHLPDP